MNKRKKKKNPIVLFKFMGCSSDSKEIPFVFRVQTRFNLDYHEEDVVTFKLKKKFLCEYDTVESAVKSVVSSSMVESGWEFSLKLHNTKLELGTTNITLMYHVHKVVMTSKNLVIEDIDSIESIDWEYTLDNQ